MNNELIYSVPCAICMNKEFSFIFSGKDRFDSPISLVVCNKCGLQQLNPRMTNKQLEEFYASKYYDIYSMDKKKLYNRRWVRGKKKVAKGILDALDSKRSLNGLRLLDIGCGHGFLLELARSRSCHVFGVEASLKNAQELNKIGFDVFEGSFQEYVKSNHNRFDVITLSHILEHVNTLQEFLLDVRSCLEPEGLLCVAVPDVGWQTYYGTYPISAHTAHIYYFSRNTLQALLELSGFKIISISYGKGGSHLRMVCAISSVKTVEDLQLPLDQPEKLIVEINNALKRRRRPFYFRLLRRGVRELRMLVNP